MSSQITPDVQKRGDVTVITFGPAFETLDEFTLDQIREFILNAANSANPAKIVIDLSHTKFFGSSFIEILFRVYNRANAAKGKFALAGLTPYCREVLEITHLDSLWPMLPNAEEAVKAVA
jgi:anti-anti-sigma factor